MRQTGGVGRDAGRRRPRQHLVGRQFDGEVTLGASLPALAFYERCGYRVKRRREWKTRGGLVLPVTDMAKTLTSSRARA